MTNIESWWLWLSHQSAHDLEESSQSYLSQIGSLEPEIFTILYKCYKGVFWHHESCYYVDIMLDPLGNVPLKLYEVSFKNIDKLLDLSWSPPLYLTPEERKIVTTPGTVLVFGRSGTGMFTFRPNKQTTRSSPCSNFYSHLYACR